MLLFNKVYFSIFIITLVLIINIHASTFSFRPIEKVNISIKQAHNIASEYIKNEFKLDGYICIEAMICGSSDPQKGAWMMVFSNEIKLVTIYVSVPKGDIQSAKLSTIKHNRSEPLPSVDILTAVDKAGIVASCLMKNDFYIFTHAKGDVDTWTFTCESTNNSYVIKIISSLVLAIDIENGGYRKHPTVMYFYKNGNLLKREKRISINRIQVEKWYLNGELCSKGMLKVDNDSRRKEGTWIYRSKDGKEYEIQYKNGHEHSPLGTKGTKGTGTGTGTGTE